MGPGSTVTSQNARSSDVNSVRLGSFRSRGPGAPDTIAVSTPQPLSLQRRPCRPSIAAGSIHGSCPGPQPSRSPVAPWPAHVAPPPTGAAGHEDLCPATAQATRIRQSPTPGAARQTRRRCCALEPHSSRAASPAEQARARIGPSSPVPAPDRLLNNETSLADTPYGQRQKSRGAPSQAGPETSGGASQLSLAPRHRHRPARGPACVDRHRDGQRHRRQQRHQNRRQRQDIIEPDHTA
ncbi:hypothetical protein SAMN05216266_13629 [Amycolatopsis marina]|uniref:Uncharacterized protein n=1 Tax=Amycolatopsis marina TaxID=490629 RepID=A0A1I1CMF0_9PSEU|nr:hypothetical protein FHX69_7244 [Prauserella muralis]SFB63657.1 hypothetical protein SAMN05216266_13629 [Amycolatopsis marina]